MASLTLQHFTLTEYHQLAELRIISEDDEVELICGQIVKTTAKGTVHEVCITRLIRELAQLVGDRATLRSQSPIILILFEYLFYQGEPDVLYGLFRGQLVPMATSPALHTRICSFLVCQFQPYFANAGLSLIATSSTT